MTEIDGDCRIRDIVRDSKTLRGIRSNFDRKDVPYNLQSHSSSCYERVFPRSSGGNDITGGRKIYGIKLEVEDFTCPQKERVIPRLIVGEHSKHVGSIFSFDENTDPFLGLYHKHGGLIYKFKQNLPVFDGFWQTEDIMSWVTAIDDFFEEINPPENVKCNIVWDKMKGRAYYWWKQIRQERNELGNKGVTSWPKMKNMILNKFLPTTCSTKCLLETYNSSKDESALEYEEDNKSITADESSVEKQPKEVLERKPAKCSIKVPLEADLNMNDKENELSSLEVYEPTIKDVGVELLEKTTSQLLMPIDGPAPTMGLSVIACVGFSKALKLSDHMGNELFYEFSRVGCKHFDPGGIRQERLLWFSLAKFSHSRVETVEMEKHKKLVRQEVFDHNSVGLEHIALDISQDQLHIEAKGVRAEQNFGVDHEYTNTSRAMNIGPQVMSVKQPDSKTPMLGSLADILIGICRFITSRFGNELGCKVHKVEKVLNRKKTLWGSNEVDILVDGMLMLSFDPGGTKSNNPLKEYWQDLFAHKDGCVAQYIARVLWVMCWLVHYCLVWRPNSTKEPMFWIGNQNCWYTNWDWTIPHIPVEELVFAAGRCFQLNAFEDLRSHNDEGVARNTVNALFLVTPLFLKCYLTKVCVVNALFDPITEMLSFMFDSGGKCGDVIYRLNAWSLARDNYYIYNGPIAHLEIKPLVLSISTFDIGMALQVFPCRKHEGNIENEVSQEDSLPRITPLENEVDVAICVTGKALVYVLSGSQGLAYGRPHGGWIIKCVKGKSLKLELSGREHKRMIQRGLLVCAYDAEIVILLSDTLCMIVDPGGNTRNGTKSTGTLDLTFESGCAGTIDNPILVAITFHRVHLVNFSDPDYGIGIVWLVSASTCDITPAFLTMTISVGQNGLVFGIINEFVLAKIILDGRKDVPPFLVMMGSRCDLVQSRQLAASNVSGLHGRFRPERTWRTISRNGVFTIFCDVRTAQGNRALNCSVVNEAIEAHVAKLRDQMNQEVLIYHVVSTLKSKITHATLNMNSSFKLAEIGKSSTEGTSAFLFSANMTCITRGRVIPRDGWNDKNNSNTFMRARHNAVTVSLCLGFVGKNGLQTLKLFCTVVNGLDPPNGCIGEYGDVFAAPALDSSSYWIRLWTSFSSRGMEMM